MGKSCNLQTELLIGKTWSCLQKKFSTISMIQLSFIDMVEGFTSFFHYNIEIPINLNKQLLICPNFKTKFHTSFD